MAKNKIVKEVESDSEEMSEEEYRESDEFPEDIEEDEVKGKSDDFEDDF